MSGENKIDPVLAPSLSKVKYPGFDQDIISMGLIKSATLDKDGVARIVVGEISAPNEVLEALGQDIAAAFVDVPGVVEMELDLRESEPKAAAPQPKGPHKIPGVKAIVPVASGKGGVGKSTVAVNLALGLAAQGLKVGLLDLDLYGPSIPTMLGIENASPEGQGELLLPIEAKGLKVMSIGFMVGADQALIWRGPLIMKAVKQLLHGVLWRPLDVLVLDLPPGTGDVQISLGQEVPIDGAVVVSTPQKVALADAIKAVEMFRQMQAPILGIVENMSYFVCPDCGGKHDIFGSGTVEPLAAKYGVEYLGEIPLDPKVRTQCDAGTPVVTCGEDTPASEAYQNLAKKVKARLDLGDDK